MGYKRFTNALLIIAGAVAIWIGASMFISPMAFYSQYSVQFSESASSLNETRASGGALLALGALIGAGAFFKSGCQNISRLWRERILTYGAAQFFCRGTACCARPLLLA